jgi:hypothetical protein
VTAAGLAIRAPPEATGTTAGAVLDAPLVSSRQVPPISPPSEAVRVELRTAFSVRIAGVARDEPTKEDRGIVCAWRTTGEGGVGATLTHDHVASARQREQAYGRSAQMLLSDGKTSAAQAARS